VRAGPQRAGDADPHLHTVCAGQQVHLALHKRQDHAAEVARRGRQVHLAALGRGLCAGGARQQHDAQRAAPQRIAISRACRHRPGCWPRRAGRAAWRCNAARAHQAAPANMLRAIAAAPVPTRQGSSRQPRPGRAAAAGQARGAGGTPVTGSSLPARPGGTGLPASDDQALPGWGGECWRSGCKLRLARLPLAVGILSKRVDTGIPVIRTLPSHAASWSKVQSTASAFRELRRARRAC